MIQPVIGAKAAEQAIGHFETKDFLTYTQNLLLDELFKGYRWWFDHLTSLRKSDPFGKEQATQFKVVDDDYSFDTTKVAASLSRSRVTK